MVRVLLVDDHPVVRSGLRALLEVSGRAEVVGEASSGEEGVTLALSLKPEIVIMDVSMPGIGGIEATRRIAALGLGIKVLVLTMHRADEFMRAAFDAGAAGFLNKTCADANLLAAIDVLARGQSYPPGARAQ